MLAVMTYSTELLICCLLGVTIGYTLFTDNHHDTASNSNPCCDFMNQPQLPTSTTTPTILDLSTIHAHPLLSSENPEAGIVRKRHAQQHNNNANNHSDDELGNCCGSKST